MYKNKHTETNTTCNQLKDKSEQILFPIVTIITTATTVKKQMGKMPGQNLLKLCKNYMRKSLNSQRTHE